MDGNAGEPSRKRREPRKLIQMLISTHVGVLHDVLGFGVIADDGTRNAVKTLVVSTHDDFVESGFSGQNAVDDLFIGPAFGRRTRVDFADWHGLINTERRGGKRLQGFPATILRLARSPCSQFSAVNRGL